MSERTASYYAKPCANAPQKISEGRETGTRRATAPRGRDLARTDAQIPSLGAELRRSAAGAGGVGLGFSSLKRDLAGLLEETSELDPFALDGSLLEPTGFAIQSSSPSISLSCLGIGVGSAVVQLRGSNEEDVLGVGLTPGNELDLTFPIATGERRGRRCEKEGGDEGQDRENTHGLLP